MQAYRIVAGSGIQGLERHDRAEPATPGAHDVGVRVRAVSLNYRDLMVARGNYLVSAGAPLVPTSDGAGEVVAVGAGVSRFKVGDRVAGIFFPHWIEGRPTPQKTALAPGGNVDGWLAEQVQVDEQSLVAVPAHLGFAEAATLPCAAVTAWNALFADAALSPGQSVLLLGTGGVSVWALQLAKAAGLQACITSSSDDKLARARALGADVTVNYRQTPQWHEEVLRQTGGRGVDLVLEVGGTGTLAGSVAAAAMGGTVAIIGGVSGFGGDLEPIKLIGGAKRLSGIYVGSREMAEQLGRCVQNAGIRPVIDRVFQFGQARQAYEHLAAGAHFGKVVISLEI
jgi:NADPH:quinone reductase-like Zn-dependent oxidoreductase